MKLSNWTKRVLQNFSDINPSILIKHDQRSDTGKQVLTTCSLSSAGRVGTMIVVAEVDTDFPSNVCLHDLSQLLTSTQTLKDSEIDIRDTSVLIHDNTSRVRIMMAQPRVVVAVSDGAYNFVAAMEDAPVKFVLTEQDKTTAMKFAAMFGHEGISFFSDGGKVYIKTTSLSDERGDNQNTYTKEIENSSVDRDFSVLFNKSNLDMIGGDYVVQIHDEDNVPVVFTLTESEFRLNYYVLQQARD